MSTIEQVNREAALKANKYFRENGFRKLTINDVARRDEETGRITFVDPDSGQQFSNRVEAGKYIDYVNEQIKEGWSELAHQYQAELLRDVEPRIRLISFAPKYDAMDEVHQELFAQVVAPYEIKDQSGNIVGYSCDLDAALIQTRNLVSVMQSKFAKSQPQTQPQTPPSTPAIDTPAAGGNGKPIAEKEPTNLSEAFAALRKQEKGK